jgi:hypothetical protein
MNKMNGLSRQRGVSFVSLIFWGAFLGMAGVLIAQVTPTFLEYQAVLGAVNKAKDGTTVAEVRSTFDRFADVDSIRSIAGKDLDISKGVGDKTVVRFQYNREIHLVGPAYLLLKYSGESK